MKRTTTAVMAALLVGLVAMPAHAALTGVSGGLSSEGVAGQIIAAPEQALDEVAANLGMQGFDEAQNVVTSQAYGIDGDTAIAAGTLVSSHMIFLNSAGPFRIEHLEVTWTFDGVILGVMSDEDGTLEAASSGELGAAGTVYPNPMFADRGLEQLSLVDGYVVNGNSITVNMAVTEPGDWIRVITAGGGAPAVPEPGTLMLLVSGLAGVAGTAWVARRRQ